MIRTAAVLAVGYVLGAKAGRQRYEQINKAYRAVSQNPIAKKAVDTGRRKLSDSISPDPKLSEIKAVEMVTADPTATLLAPEETSTGASGATGTAGAPDASSAAVTSRTSAEPSDMAPSSSAPRVTKARKSRLWRRSNGLIE